MSSGPPHTQPARSSLLQTRLAAQRAQSAKETTEIAGISRNIKNKLTAWRPNCLQHFTASRTAGTSVKPSFSTSQVHLFTGAAASFPIRPKTSRLRQKNQRRRATRKRLRGPPPRRQAAGLRGKLPPVQSAGCGAVVMGRAPARPPAGSLRRARSLRRSRLFSFLSRSFVLLTLSLSSAADYLVCGAQPIPCQ